MILSPWGWIALAILLAAVEMLTVSLVLIWSAMAAVVTGLALWLWPDLPLAGQAALFAALSVAFTFGGRAIFLRYGDGAASNRLNRRAADLPGREAVVVAFAGSEGQVMVDGVPWRARLEAGTREPAAGERVQIVSADGIVLTVRPLMAP